MFHVVCEEDIFKDHNGVPVLSGTMGADKLREVDGVVHRYLRFIVILTPINAYLRKLQGDSGTLPQAALLSMMILESDEIAWVDSEDLGTSRGMFFESREDDDEHLIISKNKNKEPINPYTAVRQVKPMKIVESKNIIKSK